jgi:hypothetical protein
VHNNQECHFLCQQSVSIAIGLRSSIRRILGSLSAFLALQPKAVRKLEAPAPSPEEVKEPPHQLTPVLQSPDDRAAQEAAALKSQEDKAQQIAQLVAQELESAKELVGEAGVIQLKAFMQNAAAFEMEQSR